MKINKDCLLISVESELEAEGEAVAQALAKLLKLPFRSEEILEEAAGLSGISEKLLHRYAERPVRHAYDLTAQSEDTLHIPPAQDFLAAQIAACRAIAHEGSCVLLNHHSNTALSDMEGHIGIFVHADRYERLCRYAMRRGIGPEKAARRFFRQDRERTRYFRSVAPHWGKASGYDLSVNSSSAAPALLAEYIVRYLETVTREELVHPTLAQEHSA